MNRRLELNSVCTVVKRGGLLCISTTLLTSCPVSMAVQSGTKMVQIGHVWALVLHQETMDLMASIASAIIDGKWEESVHHSD
jgi:hypothetical protein